MDENTLSLESYQKALSAYMKTSQYSRDERDELAETLTIVNSDVKRHRLEIIFMDIMDRWKLVPGYPVLTVTKSEGSFIKLTQKRFLTTENDSSPSNNTWTISVKMSYPVTQASSLKRNSAHLMLNTADALSLDLQERPYLISVEQSGFYRVNYDAKNWQDIALILKLDHTKINFIDRAKLLDDSFHLAQANQLDNKLALSLTEYLIKEAEYLPWQAAFKSFGYYDKMFNDASSQSEYSRFKKYVIYLLSPLYKKLGFDYKQDEARSTILNRKSVLHWLCKYGHEDCVKNSISMFGIWMNNTSSNKIDINLRGTVYTTAILHGGETEWNFLWERFLNSTNQSERQLIIYALAASTKQNLILRLLDATQTEKIESEDAVYIYQAVGSFATGYQVQFEWMQNNWAKIKGKFKSHFDFYILNMISGYAAAANTDIEITKLEAFLVERSSELGSFVRDLKRTVETSKINWRWTVNKKTMLVGWFQSQVEQTTCKLFFQTLTIL